MVHRGSYDVSAMRADADIMVWLHGPKPEALQQALRDIRRSQLFAGTESWNAMGVHREAEFAKNHTPAYSRGVAPAKWLSVYPFVRSYEWYLLPDEERRAMLADHGRKGREFPQVHRQHRRLVRARRLRVDPRRSRPTSSSTSST